MRLSAPPPLKQSTIFKANVTKVIAPDASDSDTANGRSEVQLSAALLQILVEDEKMVTKRMALPKLPARITVFDIFQQVIHSFLTFSILTCYCFVMIWK